MLATRISDVSGLRSLLWDVTGTCNLRCKHCYQYDRYGYDSPAPFSADLDHQEASSALGKAIAAGISHVHFLGGEPMLRPDLPQLIEQAKASGVAVSINTNGLPLTRRRIASLIERRVDWIMVSLDGATPDTNDAIRGPRVFNRVVANVAEAVSQCRGTQSAVAIVFTVTDSNAHELPGIMQLALDLQVSQLRIVPVEEAGNYRNNSDRLGSDTPTSLHSSLRDFHR